MAGADFLWFLAASLVLTVTPGPDNLFVIAQGLTHGRRTALFTAWGMCSGISVHTTLVAAGTAAILATTPWAFTTLRLLGAAWLCWIAAQLWISTRANLALNSQGNGPASAAAAFRRGLLMNVLNPKVALFFLAFLPQFVPTDAARPAVWTVALGATFMLQAICIFSCIAIAFASLHAVIQRHPFYHRLAIRISALAVAALAARIVISVI